MGLLDDWFGYESPAQKAREAQDDAAARALAEQKRIKKEQEAAAAIVAEEVAEEQTILESWAWTNKYLQVQRQVAQATQAMLPTPQEKAAIDQAKTVEAIKKIAVPAAGISLIWYLLR